jgi:hypothetical protein
MLKWGENKPPGRVYTNGPIVLLLFVYLVSLLIWKGLKRSGETSVCEWGKRENRGPGGIATYPPDSDLSTFRTIGPWCVTSYRTSCSQISHDVHVMLAPLHLLAKWRPENTNFCTLFRPFKFWLKFLDYTINVECLKLLKAIKFVEMVLKAFLKARLITKWRIITLGRWRPWDNFFTEVTHLYIYLINDAAYMLNMCLGILPPNAELPFIKLLLYLTHCSFFTFRFVSMSMTCH